MKTTGRPHDGPLLEKEAITVKEYAAACGVNRKTVYGAIARGELAVIRVGRALRILRSRGGGGTGGNQMTDQETRR